MQPNINVRLPVNNIQTMFSLSDYNMWFYMYNVGIKSVPGTIARKPVSFVTMHVYEAMHAKDHQPVGIGRCVPVAGFCLSVCGLQRDANMIR